MTYDIDFRFRRALAPEGLSVITTASGAVEDAIRDARSAGVDPERDPAVALLGRHLGRIASGLPAEVRHLEDLDLRRACVARIAELEDRPALVTLARRGVGYDPEAKRVFLREAGRQLRRVASAFGDHATARINHSRCVRGAEVSLETPSIWINIQSDRPTPGREITYRRNDQRGTRDATADIRAIIDADAFARRLAREFSITLAPADLLV